MQRQQQATATTTTAASTSPSARSSNNVDANDGGSSVVSNLTQNSVRTTTSIASVLSQSLQILQGKLPEEDRTDHHNDDNDGFMTPTRTISFGQVPREFSHEEDDNHDRDNDDIGAASATTSEISIDFLQDNPKDMTYGRRIALALMKKKWYNPRAGEEQEDDDDDQPSNKTDMNGHNGNNDNANEQQQPKHSPNNNNKGNHHYSPPYSNRYDENEPPLSPSSPASGGTAGYPANITHRQFPSLERAWAYFEHVALPRYIVQPKDPTAPRKNVLVRAIRKVCCKANKQLDKAEPGENHLPTKLYSPVWTPLKQMGDWGLGIGLYFSTLRAITILTLLAGLINIVNFQYFAGGAYSNGQPGLEPVTLSGSAICTNKQWVPCPDCNVTDWENDPDKVATIATTIDTTIVNLTFALRNDCDGATLQQGFVNYATLLFVLVGILIMNMYQRHMEVKYDEDEQTAQDYSVVITNPPDDAKDPDEWFCFFRDNFDGAHTTTCTIAVDNDLLVRSLLERRECMRKIEMLVEPGTSLEDLNLARIAAEIERGRRLFGRLLAMVVPGIPELYGRVIILTAKIQGLAQQDYPVSNVFLSFETEAAQRKVLSALSVGTLATHYNNTRVMKDNPNYLFRGELVLKVKEPEEPSTVRWEDLNVRFRARFKELIFTTMATFGAIVVIAFLIWALHGVSVAWSALGIAAANGIFPTFAKLLTMAESHASEGGKQTSLYFKIAVFRWVNTAIIITIITPFTKTLDNFEGLIPSIWAIFFAEIVTTNAIQLLDPVGHLQRHFLAPRAASQDLMNLNMQGQVVELAERYTNMTKILFLALWYCSIYPCSLFLCSFALLVNYFTDRFSLMRTWKRAPALGNTISRFSRRYFFSAAVVAMAIVSSYYWSGFPFDNLCSTEEETLDAIYYGSWTIRTAGSKSPRSVTVDSDNDTVYKYCLQDMIRMSGRSFPALPQWQPEGGEWMTEEQEQVTTVYGWTSLGVLGIVVLSFIWGWFQAARGLFRSTYEPNGEDQRINFSDVPSISTYVPQVVSNVFAYPLFACDIDGIDEDLFDWTDPDHPHSYYDLTKDADELLRGMDVSTKMVFSTLTHWPPERKSATSSAKTM